MLGKRFIRLCETSEFLIPILKHYTLEEVMKYQSILRAISDYSQWRINTGLVVYR